MNQSQNMFDPDEKETFHKVKDYLRSNPNSNAMQIAMATGVSISKISKYIREGTLTEANKRA